MSCIEVLFKVKFLINAKDVIEFTFFFYEKNSIYRCYQPKSFLLRCMAHTIEEQQYLLARDRIRDGELPFLKSAFDGDGWLKTFDNKETYLLMACYYR